MSLIIDLTRMSAAYGPRLLAETGHRVIRVERSSGDDVRRAGPALKDVSLEHGAVHQFLNAGKESLTLNLETTEGVDILAALARIADCVVITTPFRLPADW